MAYQGQEGVSRLYITMFVNSSLAGFDVEGGPPTSPGLKELILIFTPLRLRTQDSHDVLKPPTEHARTC